MKKKFIIEIASVPDRDYLVAEIWLGDDMIAEINQEHEIAEIKFYKMPATFISFQDFITALEEVKERLLNPK